MRKLIRTKGNYIYTLSSSVIRSEHFGAVMVYGISISGEGNCTAVEHILNDFDLVCDLFNLIVDEELYPEHLMDVIEDFLYEHSPKLLEFRCISDEPPYIA